MATSTSSEPSVAACEASAAAQTLVAMKATMKKKKRQWGIDEHSKSRGKMVRKALQLNNSPARKKKRLSTEKEVQQEDSVPSVADLQEALLVSQKMGDYDTTSKDGDKERDEEEAIEEIKRLFKPKLPTIVIFFRWARRPATHFNSDSISLVKTLALQSGLSPVSLVRDVKTYYLRTTTNRVANPPYGFRLNFAQNKKEKGNYSISKKTSVALHGFKYAFSYLQQQVASEAATMAQTRTRDQPKGKRATTTVHGTTTTTTTDRLQNDTILESQKKSTNLPIGAVQGEDLDGSGLSPVELRSSVPLPPVFRCHTPESFESRVWDELEHRALAYHVVSMIVLSTNNQPAANSSIPPAGEEDNGIDPTSVLRLSFRALSPCKTRVLFITTLARLCLMIKDSESIKDHSSFKEIWVNREDKPHALFDLAMTNQRQPEEVKSEIGAVFEFLRAQRCSRVVSIVAKNKSEPIGTLGWLSIKARVFVIWLKFAAQFELHTALTFTHKRGDSMGDIVAARPK